MQTPGEAPQATDRDPLPAEEIHVWLCPQRAVENSDRLRRELLSRYAPVGPDEWEFSVGPKGRPQIANPGVPLDFNLSHSHDWMALAICGNGKVGVDIQFCDPERDVMKLARRFYHQRETGDLENRIAEDQSARFYDYWTLKEAHVKCRGSALAQSLDSVVFELAPLLGPEHPAAHAVARWPREAGAGAFYCLLDLIPAYRLALNWLPSREVEPRIILYHYYSGEPCAAVGGRALRAASGPCRLRTSQRPVTG